MKWPNACLTAGLVLALSNLAHSTLLVGAAKENITPFTIIPGVTTPDSLSNSGASNTDGLPGGLWDTFEPEPGFHSAAQVTTSGIWGEPFTDENGNGRRDAGEPFSDDLVNTRLDVDSLAKWDGIYLAGFGSDRIPKGAFDPIWARAVYLRDTASGLAFAHATIDVLGWFSDWNDRIIALAKGIDPALDLDYLIVSHTHDHESVDTHVGIWGEPYPEQDDVTRDGTYPKYERYIELKIAQAVVNAAHAAAGAKFRFASIRPGQSFTTLNGNTEDLGGLQSRNSCRTPWVFDDEVRVAQVAADSDGATIATIVNWGTHVESMEGGNLYLSSDFLHTLRGSVETGLGGIALEVQGAQGAGEVVGDSCRSRWQRTTFDGEIFPVNFGGTPLVLENIGSDPLGARNRAYAIGRVVGSAAVAAASGASFDASATAIEGFTAQDLFVSVNNEGLAILGVLGTIDKPSYALGFSLGKETFGRLGMFTSPPSGFDTKTTIYAWKIGSASFVTAPGELFPELYYGLATHNRAIGGSPAEHFDYVSPNPAALTCAGQSFSYGAPGANTGRAFEPGIRQAQITKFATMHNFLFGYTPDLLGYIVPGYDFSWYAAPPINGVGLGAIHGVYADNGEAPDPCAAFPPDLAFSGAHYNRHYQETNSAGSMLAPAYACTVWEMLGLDPAASAEGATACVDWHAWKTGGVAHVGVDPTVCDQSSDTDCVRHY